jgi:hypothetical protein
LYLSFSASVLVCMMEEPVHFGFFSDISRTQARRLLHSNNKQVCCFIHAHTHTYIPIYTKTHTHLELVNPEEATADERVILK